jgi:hypothetical protein
MSTEHTHDHDGDDHGHKHSAAPMVEEITDYEILEIAVRELAIERGLFTAEDHRSFTEWAESDQRLAVGREGMDGPGLQGAGPRGWRQGLQGDRPRLDGTDPVSARRATTRISWCSKIRPSCIM